MEQDDGHCVMRKPGMWRLERLLLACVALARPGHTLPASGRLLGKDDKDGMTSQLAVPGLLQP